ncbi:MAG: hypothetical protein D4R77_03020 [Planctomycetaceae bacterium]|nr:MAG: hypothetical protein D4R77_03020 [Planctomycetaceae bacterium]
MVNPDEVIRAAEEVAEILESRGVGAVVIGAVALAAHGYVRFTEDLDLGVNTDLGTLSRIAEALRTAGFEVQVREPNGEDPLGGIVDVRGPFGLVQIVNYGGRFPAVIDGGLAAADTVIRPGSRLRIVPLPHLVALKLYAGGTKSRTDIVELLSRNPDADMAAIRDLCHGWRLRGLDPLIEEAAGGS